MLQECLGRIQSHVRRFEILEIRQRLDSLSPGADAAVTRAAAGSYHACQSRRSDGL